MKHFMMILVALLFTMGCSGEKKPDGLPKLYPVKLTLQQESKPLANATVTLSSIDQTWTVGGTSNAEGLVNLQTHGKFTGVPSGTWKVTVTKTEESGGTSTPPPKDFFEYKKWEAENAKKGLQPQAFNCVEEKYGSPQTTPLSVTVEQSAVEQTLDVGKSVRIQIKKSTHL